MLKMAKKTSRSAGQPAPRRSGENLNVWINSELFGALRDYLSSTQPRVTKTAAVEAALMEFLRSQGHWPPAADAD